MFKRERKEELGDYISQIRLNYMFLFVAEKPCEDVLSDCAYYFNADECDRYSGLTKKYCLKTCNYCE